MHLDLIVRHTAAIEVITGRVEVMMAPFQGFRDLVRTIPGIGPLTADVVVAETGADMSRFPTAKHLASWAGTTPGNNESAGKVKSSKTRPGNPYLQGALGAAAMACAQNPHTYLGARYRRIATRRGPQKANVAIQHSILTVIWHLGRDGTIYDDPGADYFTRLHPDQTKTQPCTNSRPWATESPSTTPAEHNPGRERESSRQSPTAATRLTKQRPVQQRSTATVPHCRLSRSRRSASRVASELAFA